jgi:hypothetical protein
MNLEIQVHRMNSYQSMSTEDRRRFLSEHTAANITVKAESNEAFIYGGKVLSMIKTIRFPFDRFEFQFAGRAAFDSGQS